MSSKDNRRPVFKRPIYSDPQRAAAQPAGVYINGSISVHHGIHELKAGTDLDYGSIHERRCPALSVLRPRRIKSWAYYDCSRSSPRSECLSPDNIWRGDVGF